MTREEIKKHYADVVRAVFVAESNVKPTISERKAALGEYPTPEQIEQMGEQYCLDIAEVILSRTSEEELKELYKEG